MSATPTATPTAGHVRYELAQATASEPITVIVEQDDGTTRIARVTAVRHSVDKGKRSVVLIVREDD